MLAWAVFVCVCLCLMCAMGDDDNRGAEEAFFHPFKCRMRVFDGQVDGVCWVSLRVCAFTCVHAVHHTSMYTHAYLPYASVP